MKKLVLSLMLCISLPIAATRFNFKNKTPHQTTILVTQEGRTETATASRDESVTIPDTDKPEFDNNGIDILQLITTEKIVESGSLDPSTLYRNRDMIYVSRKPFKREQNVPVETLDNVITKTKVYAQPNLRDKTNFSVEKGFGVKGYFQVNAVK